MFSLDIARLTILCCCLFLYIGLKNQFVQGGTMACGVIGRGENLQAKPARHHWRSTLCCAITVHVVRTAGRRCMAFRYRCIWEKSFESHRFLPSELIVFEQIKSVSTFLNSELINLGWGTITYRMGFGGTSFPGSVQLCPCLVMFTHLFHKCP